MGELKCRSCGAPIIWGKSEAGVPTPINREPDPAGNLVEIEEGPLKGRLRVIAGPLEVPTGTTIWMSHFATCPDGANWRKAKK